PGLSILGLEPYRNSLLESTDRHDRSKPDQHHQLVLFQVRRDWISPERYDRSGAWVLDKGEAERKPDAQRGIIGRAGCIPRGQFPRGSEQSYIHRQAWPGSDPLLRKRE